MFLNIHYFAFNLTIYNVFLRERKKRDNVISFMPYDRRIMCSG